MWREKYYFYRVFLNRLSGKGRHACIILHPCYGNLKIRDHEHASSGKKSIG